MIDYEDLVEAIRPYRVKDDALMPRAYQKANPQGRPFHNDWPWPFSKIPRMETAYRVPLPFKMVDGHSVPRWMPWQEGYPEAPEAQFRVATAGLPYTREVLAHDPVPAIGQSGTFAAFLNGAWMPCYYASSTYLFGRRLHTNRGLKPDLTLGDMMAWLEASLSYTKIGV